MPFTSIGSKNQPNTNHYFRDYEFEELVTSFRRVLSHPGEAIARVILIGPPGSGKSFVIGHFQEKISNSKILYDEQKARLNCIAVDCREHDSSASVVYEIIKKIDPFFQASIEDCHSAELQYILADIIQERKEALILVFDNIDSLVEKEPEEVNSLFYGFQRFSEGKNEPNLFSQILVAQDLAFLSELDRSVFRKVVTDVIHFEPYTAEETAGILQRFIKKNWQLNKISEENIWFISLISRGNIHRGQELVDKAFLLAQRNSAKHVLPEHVRAINQQISDFHIPVNKLDNLLLGDKLLLLSIARRFKTSPKAFLDVLDIPGLFFSICEEFKQLQCAKLFSDYLKNLEKLAIISKHSVDKEIVLTLSDIAAQELALALEERIKKRAKGDKFYL